jgi:superfamily II DNA or RNA helicase
MKCILRITDEVNVKFDGLELDIRKRLTNAFKKEIPHARYLPAVRLGRWDGKKAYFNLGGTSYVNLLSEILPMIDAAGYDVELDDQRNYQTHFEFQQVESNSFNNYVWPKGHVHEGEPIEIRDHQITVINQFLANPQSLQEVSTGAGKTLVTAALSHRCEPHGRTIVIVPNKSLVTQTERDYKLLNLDVGVWFGDRKEFGHKHTICTWQSLNNLMKLGKNTLPDSIEDVMTIQEFIQDVVAVIVDECHMAKADALTALLTGPMCRIPIRWGLTGTIPKEEYECISLLVSIGSIVGRLAAVDLQELGILSNCHINIRQLVDHGEYKDYQSELRYLVDNKDRMTAIAHMIAEIAESGNTLVLVDRLAAGEHICAALPDAVFISGKDKVSKRKDHYDTMAVSDNRITVATYGVAAVGIDIPRLFNVVLIEPGKSFVRTIQSIGRGLRRAHDKNFVSIWDITSTMKFSKRHLTQRKKFYSEAEYPHTTQKVDWQ